MPVTLSANASPIPHYTSMKQGTSTRLGTRVVSKVDDTRTPKAVTFLPKTPSIAARTPLITPPPKELADSNLTRMKGLAPKAPHEPSIVMGTSHASAINTYSNTSRNLVRLRIPAWVDSPYYPGTPNSPLIQLLGFSSATNAPLGIYGLHQSVQATRKSAKLGDQKGVVIGVNNILNYGSQAARGFSYGAYRVVTIGTMVHTSWASTVRPIWIVGTVLSAISYAVAAVAEFLHHPRRVFGKSFTEKLASKTKKIDYLKNRMGLDEKKLAEKALTGKTNADFRAAALEVLRPFAEKNIHLLEKHHKIKITQALTTEKLDLYLTKHLGKSVLIDHGKRTLIENLRAKKIQKMIRELGGPSGYKAAATAVLNPKLKDVEVEKIVLNNIDIRRKARNKRIAVYVAGTIAMALLCFFPTGPIGIALAVAYLLLASAEMTFSWQRFNEVRKETSAPGKYDRLFPIGYIGISVACVTTAFILANVFSFGIPALILGTAIAAGWIGINIYSFICIGIRREKHFKSLLEKKQLTLSELDYLRTYLEEEKLKKIDLLKKLPPEEGRELELLLKEPSFKTLKYKEKLKKAIEILQTRLELRSVKAFWSSQSTKNILPSGVVALSKS